MALTRSGEKFLSSFKADGAITADTFVMISDEDLEVKVATAGAKIIGISTNVYTTGSSASIAYAGEYKLKLGGTVTRGGYIKSDANGLGLAVTTDLDEYGAIALQSGVIGDTITVIIQTGIYGE